MPDWNNLVRQRLAPLGLNAASEADLTEEFAHHLEDLFRELRAGGASEEDALRDALAELDQMYRVERQLEKSDRAPRHELAVAGDARRGNILEDLARDLRYAFRAMRRSPVFVLFVIVTLALGIGANTTVFTIINTLILNPLPVRDAATLAAVVAVETNHSSRTAEPFPISYPDLTDYRQRNEVFRSLAGFTSPQVLTIQQGNASDRIFGELVTANYFETLGLAPTRGRFFRPEDDATAGANPVAVLNYATWQARFGGRADIIGKTVRLNRIPLTVVGVAPRGFIGVNAIFGPDFWIPVSMAETLMPNEFEHALADRGRALLTGVGRLDPGTPIARAQADIESIASALRREFPAEHEGHSVSVRPVRDIVLGGTPVVFAGVVLLIVVGIVLLIACSNVANLLLARAASRRQEMAVRLAMGASRRRLVRQLLTESLLLGLMSGALGLFVGSAGLRLIFGQLPSATNFAAPKLDGTVFAFALAVSLATGFIFGLVPAFNSSRADVAETLREEGRGAGRSRRKLTIGNALVVGQVAFSFLLLVTAALFLRSIARAYQLDPGFQTAHLATFMTNPGQAGYTKAETKAFYDDARARVAALPDVASVAWSSNLPLWARPVSGIEVEGRQQRSRADVLRAVLTTVDAGYFATAGVAIESGRAFSDLDRDTSLPVAIVNRKMAQDYWPGGALGKRVLLPGEKRMRVVIGVARNANYTNWAEAPQLCVYVPLAQNYSDSMVLFVRTKGDPRQVVTPIERAVHALAPEVLMSFPRTGSEIVAGGLFQAKMAVALLTVFGLLALGLATIGLYGVIAYSVNQRTREIGVRMALGATPFSVRRMVLRDGMSLVAVGLIIGLVAALGGDRLLSGMLYGVSPSDPLSVAAAAATLAIAALMACYLPAHWATRVDPVTALRES